MHWPLWWCVLCHWSSSGAGEGEGGRGGEGGERLKICTGHCGVVYWVTGHPMEQVRGKGRGGGGGGV